MLFHLLFVTSLAFSFTTSHNVAVSQGATWVLGNSANPSQLEPVGEDPHGTLYVARTRVYGQWIPGKGYYRDSTFYADVVFRGQEIENADCQTLLRGGTKWITQQKGGQIPSYALLAGYDPRTHERTYLCRGYVSDQGRPWLMVGKVLETYNSCKIPYNGQTSVYSYEILVESWSKNNVSKTEMN